MSLAHQTIILNTSVPTLLSYDGNDNYVYVELSVQNVDDSASVYLGTDGLSEYWNKYVAKSFFELCKLYKR